MANSPSQRWENGVLVERAIETNRWKIDRFGNTIEEQEPIVEEKRVDSSENKSVQSAETKKPAKKKEG